MLTMVRSLLTDFTALLLLCTVCAGAFAEEYDVDSRTGFRMERYRGPVPVSAPGAITVDTAFMRTALAEGSFVLIDVYPPKGLGPDPISGHWVTPETRESLPNTTWLPEVGRGHLEPDYEDYFRRNLQQLTNHNTSTPIVFFCTADCWQSWNASVRASQWGYTKVHWYPTGTDGWQEEGGDVLTVEPVNFLATPNEQSSKELAAVFPTQARILLNNKAGDSIDIGSIQFQPAENGEYGIKVSVESDSFNDHFLSMRPFKCLDGAAEWFCHQPYLYPLNNIITEDDVTDLEYQLLFIRKTAKEFGIDAWNGLYFKLARGDDGLWHGHLLEGDLNVLQSPPPSGVKPIDLAEFIDAETDERRFTGITLQPTP